MKQPHTTGALLALLGLAPCTGCHDGVSTEADGTSTGDATTDSATTTSATSADTTDGSTTDPDSSSGSTGQLPPPEPTEFVVTIENLSSTGLLWSPLSPGVWANHEVDADVLFEVGAPDDGEGLEALAEDGDPSALAAAVASHPMVVQAGVFDTPTMAGRPGPLLPGDVFQISFVADPGTRLSLATMLVGSNDLVVGTDPLGLSLFAGDGLPLPERDVSASLRIWDAGTERNQAPGQGPWQALHGGSPDVGPAEAPGVVPHGHSTRAIPLGPDLVSVSVDLDGMDPPMDPGTLVITLTNVSQARGTLVTALSSLVWALHDDTVGLLVEGAPASAELRALAEDGDPAPMDAMLAGMPQVEQHAVVPGPLQPGDEVVLTITPSASFPMVSLATMVVQSNDAFLALGPDGVRLFEGGALRSEDDIEDDIVALLTPWDAGTEANEVPGVGPNQAPRQPGPDTGPSDPDPAVRRYADVTDDLAGPLVGEFLDVAVALGVDTYTITITNVSDATAFPLVLSPAVWALHDDTVHLFDVGAPASSGLQTLAEDGLGSELDLDLAFTPGVSSYGVHDELSGPGMPMQGPLLPGQTYEIAVTPDPTHRFLSIVSMLMPSNDTFVAVDPPGVALLDRMGNARPPATVQAEIAAALRAWDAGTEGDQAGAAGRDMAPGGLPDTGPSNGSGLVREADEGEIWSVPRAQGLVRVIVAPVR